jgi:hypothetical protein
MKERGEVAVVKLHAKMYQGLKGIEALTAGAQILACVGDTEDGDSEELTEWLELLQTNNELREDLHEGVATQRRKELNDAARRGTVYAMGISAVYTHHVYGSDARGLLDDTVEGEDTGIEGQGNHTR